VTPDRVFGLRAGGRPIGADAGQAIEQLVKRAGPGGLGCRHPPPLDQAEPSGAGGTATEQKARTDSGQTDQVKGTYWFVPTTGGGKTPRPTKRLAKGHRGGIVMSIIRVPTTTNMAGTSVATAGNSAAIGGRPAGRDHPRRAFSGSWSEAFRIGFYEAIVWGGRQASDWPDGPAFRAIANRAWCLAQGPSTPQDQKLGAVGLPCRPAIHLFFALGWGYFAFGLASLRPGGRTWRGGRLVACFFAVLLGIRVHVANRGSFSNNHPDYPSLRDHGGLPVALLSEPLRSAGWSKQRRGP